MKKNIFILISLLLLILIYRYFYWKPNYLTTCNNFVKIEEKEKYIKNYKNLFEFLKNNGIEYSIDDKSCKNGFGIIFYVENKKQLNFLKEKLINFKIPYKIINV